MDNAKQMKQFSNELHEAHQNNDFQKQQEMYSKHSSIYDDYCKQEGYHAHQRLVEKIKELYPKQRNVKILDYGCGTGLASDALFAENFQDIDGLDPNSKLLNVARSKGIMKVLYNLSSEDDDSMIQSGRYDLVCSSGVFFPSPSYPGYRVIAKICRYVKPGGYIVICTGDILVNDKNNEYQLIEDLKKDGRIEILQRELVDNYRDPVHTEEGELPLQGLILTYKLL